MEQPPLRIFTWHIHGTYLYYLSQGSYEIYIPVSESREEGYVGRGATFPFGSNVIEVPASEVRYLDFDVILFQTEKNYFVDQYDILSESQRTLPRIFLEHDPPWDHPTNAKHPLQDPAVTLVHVTHFNALMWDNNGLPFRVIEHGVMPSLSTYSGQLEKGIVVINNLPSRGRLLGLDVFEQVRKYIPLDLVGMGSENYGLGEVLHPNLPNFISQYRFFFNPIRYTSLGLAVCEAMAAAMPIVGLATTEMAVTIKNGHSGFIHTRIDYLIQQMKVLLDDPELARQMGTNARLVAEEKFNIDRFTRDWEMLFREKATRDKIYLYN